MLVLRRELLKRNETPARCSTTTTAWPQQGVGMYPYIPPRLSALGRVVPAWFRVGCVASLFAVCAVGSLGQLLQRLSRALRTHTRDSRSGAVWRLPWWGLGAFWLEARRRALTTEHFIRLSLPQTLRTGRLTAGIAGEDLEFFAEKSLS